MSEDFNEIEKRLIGREFGREIKWLDAIYDAGCPPWDGSDVEWPQYPRYVLPKENGFTHNISEDASSKDGHRVKEEGGEGS
jgi:hypothetical protein